MGFEQVESGHLKQSSGARRVDVRWWNGSQWSKIVGK